MSEPGIPIGFGAILDVCGSASVDDLGVPIAAAARVAARLMDQDVYHGPHLKAAVLLDTLLRHPWLSERQARTAWAAAAALLAVNGYRMRPEVPVKEYASLLTRIVGPAVPITEIAAHLRAWSESAPER